MSSPRALIVSGGWDGHRPLEIAAIFARVLASAGFEVERSESLDSLADADRLRGFRLIVPNWTMGDLKGEQEKGLLAAVGSGVGCAGAHGGMGDAFRGACGFQFMVGGQFVGHPDGIKPYRVHFVKRHDPVVAGLPDFDVTSEQYYLHVDPSNDVLAISHWRSKDAPWIDNCVMPVAWKRQHGAGRVFYNSLGHAPDVWDLAPALELQRRGFLWAAGLL